MVLLGTQNFFVEKNMALKVMVNTLKIVWAHHEVLVPVNKDDTEELLHQCSLISTLGVPLLESLFKFTTYTTLIF